MRSTRRLIAIGAVLVVVASGTALAEMMPGQHPMGSDQTQGMMPSGQQPMGSSEMQRRMHQHHQQGAMPIGAHSEIVKSPCAGQQSRAIKALSEEDVTALQNGDGMGMAKAAELNGYPGPRHVLALAKELGLTEAQATQTTALRDRMSAAARPLGTELIERERALNQLFVDHEITPEQLIAETTAIGDIQGRLRAAHLAAHLEMRGIMTPEQVAQYDKLRGYFQTGTSNRDRPGRHQH